MRILFMSLILSLISYRSNLLLASDKETLPVSLYKPNYITIDLKDFDLKFQLSYRMRIVHFRKSVNLFVSHTHKAYWAITSENSAPFREHNFNPELHLRWDDLPRWTISPEHAQIGYEHESTGVAGSSSRSWDRITGQAEWTFFKEDHSIRGHMHGYLRVWKVIDKDEDNNKDIDKKIGPGEIHISYSIHERWKVGGQLAFTLRKRSIMAEYGLKFPYQDFFYYVQYWNGRGEWLVDYKDNTDILRVGIKFFVE